MPFTRQWTPEQVADVVIRHVAGESSAAIGRAHGRSTSTITRLLAKPDVQGEVAHHRAGQAAAVEQADAAVREQKQRETSRRSSAAHRTRERRVAQGVHPSGDPKRRPAKGATDGRVLGVVIGGLDAQGRPPEVIVFDREHAAEQFTYTDYLDRQDLPPAPGLNVVEHEGGQFVFDVLDPADLRRAADILEAEAVAHGFDRNELLATLSRLTPGQRVRFTYEPEEPSE